ncbi:MAG: glycosyltransferase family 4 protein [Phycisphaerales bacterium]|nr:glycosyltransferase family 4 protein [Phycisphaerales bacterium]
MNLEYVRQIRRTLMRDDFDVLFFPASSSILKELDVDIPCVYLSDATFRLMTNYYPHFSNLWEFNKRSGERAEAAAIEKAKALVYSSSWAARSAIEHYGACPERTHVIHLGANFDEVPHRNVILSRRSIQKDRFELLFVGGDWRRKGGDIALGVLARLQDRGIACTLTVAGSRPHGRVATTGVRFAGFLDKNTKAGMKALSQLYLQADVFLLPTRNEAAGIVFCEASAFGLPVVSTRTGGVESYVEDGMTGFLCQHEEGIDGYADRIERLVTNPDEHFRMSVNARDKFERELNWDVWGRRVAEVLRDVCDKNGHPD